MANNHNRSWMAPGCSVLACFAMIVGNGCAARVYSESGPAGVYPSTVEEDGIVYVDTVPPNIEANPRYAYGGGDAYYVDGRWYRRGPRGWGYYRQEPPELARQRASVVVRAPAPAPPPAIPRERSDTERAPAAPHERQQEQQAPGHEVHHERQEAERAPAAPHERSREDQAHAAPHPRSRAAEEVPPHSGEAPRGARPDDKPAAPQKEHEH